MLAAAGPLLPPLTSYLLDRLEDLFAPGGPLSKPTPYRLEQIADAWSRDPRTVAVARVWNGGDLDPTLAAEQLLRAPTVTAVTGPSGRGKSTLLYVLGLMLTPSRGQVVLDGQAVSSAADSSWEDSADRASGVRRAPKPGW